MIRTHLQAATSVLAAKNIPTPRLAAELFMAHVLDCERIALLLRDHLLLEAEQEARFTNAVNRHAQGEPVAYIIGERAFFGRTFQVNKATLIPRPESEHLIEHALLALPETPLIFADFGTGSGCLAITLLAERPTWRGLALDISYEALQVARSNAQTHDVSARLQLVQASFIMPILQANSCDLIIANPPYISRHDYTQLDDNVLLFEPQNALTPENACATGLEHLAAILEHAIQYLKPHGLLVMEHAYDQGNAVRELCKQQVGKCAHLVWREVSTHQDLAGHDRMLFARK